MVINCKKEKIMKRIYSFVFAAIAILSAASCQKEIVAPEADSNATAFSFVAEREAETKTTLVNGKSTYWTPGDKVSAFDSKGTAVTFATAITENSASALFACESFSIPGNGPIHAVYPAKPDAKLGADGVIGILRVGGTQKAVAGSFDPEFAVAYAKGQVTDLTTPPALQFTNIHSLVKFTIGGDKAPGTVVLTNGGARNIAGQFSYNTNDGTISQNPDIGAKEITLTPAEGDSFKVGETYYIVVIGGGNFANITLTFDETVVKTVSGAKYADETNNFLLNKIIDFGTVQFPSEEPEPEPAETPFNLERVAAYYSNGANAWCSFIPGISNRTMAADNKYVYLQSSESTAKIYAVEISSLLNGDETPAYKSLSTSGISGGTHAVSALRCIPNEAGDPILIATNLAVDATQNFNIYAYSNGTDADPVLFHAYRWDGVANASDWRRYGDRISVTGTWQNGKIYAPSQSGTKVMGFGINNGATSADLREFCWFETFGGGLAEATVYPGTTEAILTTASSAGFWTPNTEGEKHSGGFWPKWDLVRTYSDLNGAFSFQFFTFEGKKYIAYVQLPDNAHANLVIVEDKGGFEESLTSAKLFELPLYEGDKASCIAGNTYGDCAVVTVSSKLYIVAMMQGGGLSIFEIQSK